MVWSHKDEDEREKEVDLESKELQKKVNHIDGDIGSSCNTNSRKNSKITAEIAKMIKCEITNQVTWKLDEIKN